MPAIFAEFSSMRNGSNAITATCRHGVHRRARQIVDAADAHRQRTAKAALRIAVEMADEGLITKDEAIQRIEPASLDQLLHPTIGSGGKAGDAGQGLPARPAPPAARSSSMRTKPRSWRNPAARSCWCASKRAPRTLAGCMPPRPFSPPAAHDLACGGGGARHGQALRLRAGALRIDYDEQCFTVAGAASSKATWSPSTARSGTVIAGAVKMQRPELTGEFAVLMQWADKARRLKVPPTPKRPPTPAPRGASARRHRPRPHRAHVSSRASASSPCAR